MRGDTLTAPIRHYAAALALACLLLGLPGSRVLAAAPTCPTPTDTVRVAAVVDDLDLALEDGRTLKLAGIDPARATASRLGLGETARRRLDAELVGRDVAVAILSASPDRWDRYPALVMEPVLAQPSANVNDADASSLNAALIAQGWARARPDPPVRACFAAWLALEAQARTAGLGLWADPYYSVLGADDRRGLSERAGAMALVEGRVRLLQSQGRVSLGLGGGSGLVVNVMRSGAKSLARAGLDPHGLVGAKVRVRGFLDDRFGPRIEVSDPGQIEIVEMRASRPESPALTPSEASGAAGEDDMGERFDR